jgi:ATP-dependent DNA helicase RecG
MFLRELRAGLDHLKGVGPAAEKALAKAGIVNVAGLLCHYPRDWEDRSVTVLLKDYEAAHNVCTVVQVLAHEWFGFGRMKTLKIHVEDESFRAVLVCFNRPFLEKQMIIGRRYRLWGHFFYKYGELQCSQFEAEPFDTEIGHETAAVAAKGVFGHILPVYPLSAGLGQAQLRRLMREALRQYAPSLEDELPQRIITRYGFFPKAEALRALHFPATLAELETARRTIIYEELFYLEVIVASRSIARKKIIPLEGIPRSGLRLSSLQTALCERLPFKLTAGQLHAVAEINADMEQPWPMARLLQGDVGSGKTLVSFLAALKAVEAGGQVAIMAPTELLARQHAENAARLLEPVGMRVAFLTGNVKSGGRANLLKALAAGDVDIAVGTHALFSRDVVYKNLAFVTVDEQHRFGVVQRQTIMAKGKDPHLLMMSATPIPRTLSLTIYGDMDVSVITGLPPGRKPVETHLAKISNEKKVYDFVRNELRSGAQAYFVYPLIDSGDERDLKDAESMAERLSREVYPDFKCALIHSRLDEEEKRRTMEAFRTGETKLLVATSVVEVGVDVPNATVMVIEHAERFGLSALHQLRGRVGRGGAQSYCFLVFSENLTEDGKARLMVMKDHADGFVIAEEDLRLRGPGQIAGIEQSGRLSLGLSDPVRDVAVLETARADAFALLAAISDAAAPKPVSDTPAPDAADAAVINEVLKRAPPFASSGL